jgi:hypothetical protein
MATNTKKLNVTKATNIKIAAPEFGSARYLTILQYATSTTELCRHTTSEITHTSVPIPTLYIQTHTHYTHICVYTSIALVINKCCNTNIPRNDHGLQPLEITKNLYVPT